jgi:hypothetical protein
MKPQKFYKIALQVMSKLLKYFMLNYFNFHISVNSAYFFCAMQMPVLRSFLTGMN